MRRKPIRIAIVLIAAALLLSGCVAKQKEDDRVAKLSFHSFEGGGPSYSVRIADPAIVSCQSERAYAKANRAELDGAGYTVTFTFRGEKPGETAVTVEERSPIGGDYDRLYYAFVDEDLRVSIEEFSMTDLNAATEQTAVLVIGTETRLFYASLADNSAAEALKERLSSEMLTLKLQDYGSFEKVGELPWTLPTEEERITTSPGDVTLYQGNQLSVSYDENTWELTRLGTIDATREELLEAFGEGDATVSVWLEWSE